MIIVKSSFSSSSLSVCRERRHILPTATKYVWRQNMPQHNRFSPLPCSLTVASPPSQWENKHRQPATTRVATAAGTGHVHIHATGCSGCFTGGHSRFYTGALVGGRRAAQYTVHDVKGLWQTLRQGVRQHVLCYQLPPPPFPAPTSLQWPDRQSTRQYIQWATPSGLKENVLKKKKKKKEKKAFVRLTPPPPPLANTLTAHADSVLIFVCRFEKRSIKKFMSELRV